MKRIGLNFKKETVEEIVDKKEAKEVAKLKKIIEKITAENEALTKRVEELETALEKITAENENK